MKIPLVNEIFFKKNFIEKIPNNIWVSFVFVQSLCLLICCLDYKPTKIVVLPSCQEFFQWFDRLPKQFLKTTSRLHSKRGKKRRIGTQLLSLFSKPFNDCNWKRHGPFRFGWRTKAFLFVVLLGQQEKGRQSIQIIYC